MIVALPDLALDGRTGYATRALRSQILEGRLPQGSRRSEVRLAKELELSRGPIREALRGLEREGIVTFIPSHGTFVARAGRVQAIEAIELRERLEPFAFAQAATRRGHAIVAPLLGILAEMRARVQDGSTAGLSALHARYHGALYEQAGHGALARAWRDLEAVTILHMNATAPSLEQARALIAEHEQLAAVLVEADPETATPAIVGHLGRAKAALVAMAPGPPVSASGHAQRAA